MIKQNVLILATPYHTSVAMDTIYIQTEFKDSTDFSLSYRIHILHVDSSMQNFRTKHKQIHVLILEHLYR